MDWEKNRLWQVHFEVQQPLESMPYPEMLVEEVQCLPTYRCIGRNRSRESGGQLQLTLAGSGILEIDGETIELRPGMAFLHCHRDPRVNYRHPSGHMEPWRFLWISFEGVAAERMLAEMNERYGYAFRLSPDQECISTLLDYRHYPRPIRQLSPPRAAAMVLNLFDALSNPIERERLGHPHRVLASLAQEYIIAHLESRLTTGEIAAELQISREHLSRIFREQTGMTIRDYIMRRKLTLADNLLRQNSFSCKEIAEKLGFDEPSSFTRAYRRMKGVAPGMLRRG